MSINITFTEHADYLHVTLSSTNITFETAAEKLQEIDQYYQGTAHKKIFVESPLKRGDFSTQDLFALGKKLTKLHFGQAKIAVLVDPGCIGSDTTFFELVAEKAGIALRFFGARDLALSWLL